MLQKLFVDDSNFIGSRGFPIVEAFQNLIIANIPYLELISP
jgi:hypothetical protein